MKVNIKNFFKKNSKENIKLTPKIIFIKFVRIIFISYFTMLIFLYFNQKSMLYYPDYPRMTDFYDCYSFEDEEKKEYKNTRFYEKKGTNNNVVIFFHGNAGRACDRETMKMLLEKTENNIIFVEYYGYAQNNGNKPDIKNILLDTMNIGEYVETKNFESVFLLGRSVGTGPASYYTQNFKTDRLLLISPYSQLYKVASDKYPFFPIKLLFTQNYNNEEYLQNYREQLLIIHGNKDEIVPFELGRELYYLVNTDSKYFLELENGDHNNLLYSEKVSQRIREFFN